MPSQSGLPAARRILSAELLAVGSEITTGDIRDTNGGDLARELGHLGVSVTRLVALPDDLPAVTGAIVDALSRADLVVTTGGLGPTPDDLTREAIAAACGEVPVIDPGLEAWLRDIFTRRGLAMPERNVKQAWLIPSARALPNPNGTAPGWWVDRPDERVIVALPGPPREIQAMWQEHVVPMLRERGVGAGIAVRTLRLTQIGESHVAEGLGDAILHASNPVVATYAKADAVEVRITAHDEPGPGAGAPGVTGTPAGRSAAEVLVAAEAAIEERFAGHIFARDDETWVDALTAVLQGRTLACVEIGTGGMLAGLIGEAPWLLGDEYASGIGQGAGSGSGRDLLAAARRARRTAGADVGMAVRARQRGRDTAVTVALAVGASTILERRVAFLSGSAGRRRAALAACAILWAHLREAGPPLPD